MNYRACVRRIKPVIPHITRSYIRYCYNANDHISARKQTHQRTKSNTSTHANYHINTRKQPPQRTQTTASTHARKQPPQRPHYVFNARTTSSMYSNTWVKMLLGDVSAYCNVPSIFMYDVRRTSNVVCVTAFQPLKDILDIRIALIYQFDT